MQFVTSRFEALEKLNKFIENDISSYSTKRNFDFGIKKEIMFLVYLPILLIDLLPSMKLQNLF